MSAYDDMLTLSQKLGSLLSIILHLEWDSQTYIPKNGYQIRADQLSVLKELIFNLITSSSTNDLLQRLQTEYDSLNPFQQWNVQRLQLEYDQKTKIPLELTLKESDLATKTFPLWVKAKATNNYSLVRKNLEDIFAVKRDIAHLIDPSKSPFDVYIDQCDTGLSASYFEKIANNLKLKLKPLLSKCLQSDLNSNQKDLNLFMPIEQQRHLTHEIVQYLGYDFDSGRLDETEHPFTNGFPGDVRITTHYYENDFSSALFSSMHEAGHGIHFQNISKELYYSPLVLNVGISSLSESQSRFYENVVGRSKSFWDYAFPILNKYIKTPFSLEDFVLHVNNVRPNKIRIESDELTYQFHIITRFELEKALFEDKLTVKELPNAWNDKMNEYLDLTINSDSEGVLQDVHWYTGLLGYFQSYTLGNLMNAQFYNTMKKNLQFNELLRTGQITQITSWLKTNVHSQIMLPDDLLKKITGESLNSDHFINYLTEKYTALFEI